MHIHIWLEKKIGPIWIRVAPKAVKYLVAETPAGILQIKTVLCSIANIPKNCIYNSNEFTVRDKHYRWCVQRKTKHKGE